MLRSGIQAGGGGGRDMIMNLGWRLWDGRAFTALYGLVYGGISNDVIEMR